MDKILRVDLSNEIIEEEEYREEYLRKYGGQDGFAAKVLYDEVAQGISFLDPENRLVISTGPLAGTKVQAACNYSATSKSFNEFTIYNAHCNGSFAPMLRGSGYIAVVIKGKARRPVYLWLHNGRAEIRDASQLWGTDTYEVDTLIKEELKQPKLSCICIGPAGENLLPMAAIVNDHVHLAARGGLGAVMGSKNLKAIAAYGDATVPIANESKFKKLAEEWRKINMDNKAVDGYSKYGTAVSVGPNYMLGDLPINNYSTGVIEGWERLTGEYVVERMLKRHITCRGCTIAHNKLLKLKEGAFAGLECKMPEYEVMAAWGSNIGVTDPTVAAKGGEICNQLGLDSLAVSNVIAFAMECYEKGLIDKQDTDGADLRFGNYEAAFQMIDKIVKREGFGSILSKGTVRAAEYIGKGSERFTVHVKNMSIPMHDFRAFWGLALQYAVGSAGPAHEGGPLRDERSGLLPRFSIEGKAKAVKEGQERQSFLNTLGICTFGAIGVPIDLIVETLSAATGLAFTVEDAKKIGLRLVNLRRAFNIRHGLTPEDDTLSHRLLEAPPDGGAKGKNVPIKPMVYEYYEVMGWDVKTGKPYRRTLEELDLADVSRDLWR